MTTVYNIDCVEYMRTLPDKHFDLCIADPPYFSGPERRDFYGSRISTTKVRRRNYGKSDKWDLPDSHFFDEMMRTCKHYIVWGCNYFDYRFDSGRIVWDKCNGSSSFSDCEIAATNLFCHVRMFRYMWNGMMQGSSIERGYIMQGNKALNEKRIHPTQKPVALYAWILQRFAKPGYTIFDSHLGSGSSRIAAYRLGFDFVGCEIDKRYFDLQEKRFQEECEETVITPGGKTITQLTLDI